jgi:Exopolyphosphatase-related proteins
MSKREMKKFYASPGETDGFVNMPLDISGIAVSIFAREDDVIRISFRSVGDVPVNQLANELFGGGGHKNAAGAHYTGTLDEAIQIIKEALPDFYHRIDKQLAPSDLVPND